MPLGRSFAIPLFEAHRYATSTTQRKVPKKLVSFPHFSLLLLLTSTHPTIMERKTVRYKYVPPAPTLFSSLLLSLTPARWDAHSTLAALQAIAASPRYRVHFFPPPGGACLVDKWKAERDLTLQLLAGSLWLDDAVRLGLASRVGGVCRPTDKWTSSTSTPVRSLLVK